eukprot:3780634-Prymnesium_polylepis.2
MSEPSGSASGCAVCSWPTRSLAVPHLYRPSEVSVAGSKRCVPRAVSVSATCAPSGRRTTFTLALSVGSPVSSSNSARRMPHHPPTPRRGVPNSGYLGAPPAASAPSNASVLRKAVDTCGAAPPEGMARPTSIA